jgi:hypothetical protein
MILINLIEWFVICLNLFMRIYNYPEDKSKAGWTRHLQTQLAALDRQPSIFSVGNQLDDAKSVMLLVRVYPAFTHKNRD